MWALQDIATLIALLVALITLGGFIRRKSANLNDLTTELVDEVNESTTTGSIKRNGKSWDYTVTTYGSHVDDVDLDTNPRCTDCGVTLSRTQDNLIGLTKRVTVWECPKCGSYTDYVDNEVDDIREEIRAKHSPDRD